MHRARANVLTDADRLEIADLAATYAHAVDRRDFDLLHHVFVVDARLDTGKGVREGIDQIVDAMQRLLRYEATFHLLGQQRLVGGPDTATGETYCDAHHLTLDGDARADTIMKIRYADEFVRTDVGWQIAARRLHVDWTEHRALD